MTDKDFGLICVCAVRYALGRMTYMPSVVQEFIKRNIDYIDENGIYVMIRDIEECKYYGMECDKVRWMEFLAFLKEHEVSE